MGSCLYFHSWGRSVVLVVIAKLYGHDDLYYNYQLIGVPRNQPGSAIYIRGKLYYARATSGLMLGIRT